MKNYEVIIDSICPRVIFHDKRLVFMDIDSLFKDTNVRFSQLLDEYNLPKTFDFTKQSNKRLYTHAFLLTVCEDVKKSPYILYFYSNLITKDKFRNTLLKKLKSVFGFNVMEDMMDFGEVVNSLIKNECNWVSKLEVFFDSQIKPKTFKHIRRYMENNGLRGMDSYFQEVSNKMMIMK